MVVDSSSSSSSSDSDGPVPNKPSNVTRCSDSDFEAPKKTPTKIAAKVLKTHPTVNAAILDKLKQGSSLGANSDFSAKMLQVNALLQKNLARNSKKGPLMAGKKLGRIGFDDEQSSSDAYSKSPKTPIKVLSKGSDSSDSDSSSEEEKKVMQPVAKPAIKANVASTSKISSSSSSDSEEEDAKKKALESLKKTEQISKKKESSDSSDSSDSETEKKKQASIKQVSFSRGTSNTSNLPAKIATPQNTASSSSSDSESEDENRRQQIAEMKKQLKLLKESSKRKRTSSSSSSSDSESGDNKKAKVSKDTETSELRQKHGKESATPLKRSTSLKGLKPSKTRGSSNDTDSSDDAKMTSLLTQRETPQKSKNAEDSDSSSDSIHSNKASEDILPVNKLISQFLEANPDYKHSRIMSSFDPTKLTNSDEMFICNIPKSIAPESLINKTFDVDKISKILFGNDSYKVKPHKFANPKQTFVLIDKNKQTKAVKLELTGRIEVTKVTEQYPFDLSQLSSDDKPVTFPDLKQRHPLFGKDLSKVKLDANVQSRLDDMISDLYKKVQKSTKKKQKDMAVNIKDDVYKMMNFLMESNNKVDTVDSDCKIAQVEKSKKKRKVIANFSDSRLVSECDSEIATKASNENVTKPKIKKKKSDKNSSIDQSVENVPESKAKKPKKSKAEPQIELPKLKKAKIADILVNSTIASPSVHKELIFEANESRISQEYSPKTKHLIKSIDSVATACEVIENNEILPDGNEPIKKKKKKSKKHVDDSVIESERVQLKSILKRRQSSV